MFGLHHNTSVFLRLAVLLAALTFALVSIAQPHTFVLDGVQFTLAETPCSVGVVLAAIEPEARQHFQDGSVIFKNGSQRQFCWALDVNGLVHIQDDEGEHVHIPLGVLLDSRPKGPRI